MLRTSQKTTGLNVVIPTTTESNQGELPHDSTNNEIDVASATGTNRLSSRANRCLCRCGSAGAAAERYPPPFQTQYSGQPWLRHRGAARTALPGAARAVRGIPSSGPVHVDRWRQDVRGSGRDI